MKFNFPINNFSSGEWSPRMLGRTDTDQYARACADLTNMIVQMSGGAVYRGAFQDIPYDATAHASALTAFNGIDWRTEFKMISHTPISRPPCVLMNLGRTWYTQEQGLTASVSYSADAGPDMPFILPSRIQYCHIGDYLVMVDGTGQYQPKIFYIVGTPGAGIIVNFRQAQAQLTTPWKTIPWGPIEALDSNVTLTPAAATVNTFQTVTASNTFFTSGMIGTYLRFANGTNPAGVGEITAVTNATTATILIRKQLPNGAFAYGSTTNNGSFWQQSAWSNTKGWPRTVTAFQGRLIFGGTKSQPDTLWGSRISSPFDFQEVPEPNTAGPLGFAGAAYAADNSRPFTLTPNTPESANIVTLSSSKTLTVHTDTAEIVAYGSNGALGPINVVFESSTSFGASPVQPVRINNFLTFVQKTGRKIRDIIFNFSEDQYKSTDLAFTADHYFLDPNPEGQFGGVDPILEMAKTEMNSSVLWVRTWRGFMYAVTLDRDYQVNAWSKVLIGQPPEHTPYPTDPDKSKPVVLAMCSHPVDAGRTEDGIWALIGRKNGATFSVQLEVMRKPIEVANPGAATLPEIPPLLLGNLGGLYLDGATYATVTPNPLIWDTNQPTGPTSQFKNMTVSVVGDGNYLGEFEADGSGQITLLEEYTVVLVGFKYLGRIVTAPIETGGQTGVPVGRQKRVNELVIRLSNTADCFYGKIQDDVINPMFEVPIRESSLTLGQPVEYFTGDITLDFPPGYEGKAQVVIEQRAPYPLHVVAIVPQGVTYD